MSNTTDTFRLNPDFYLDAFEAVPKALVVLDNSRKIRYFNAEAAHLFNLDQSFHPGSVFGKAIQCSEANSFAEPVHQMICKNCRLEKSVSAAFMSQTRQVRETMVMQLNCNNKELLKLVQFESSWFNSVNTDYVIIIFDDLTETGEIAVSLT